MPVGQAVIVALVFGQAVAVHLRQEAEMIGQGEVPDSQRHGQPQRVGIVTRGTSTATGSAQSQRAGILAGRHAVGK